MMLPKRAFGKRFGLLAALVAALVIACTGVVLAQDSAANSDYESSNPVTPNDTAQAGAGPVTYGSSAASDVSAEARVPNGDFKTGDFSRWARAHQPGGDGTWFVYSGTTSPRSDLRIAAPPSGNFAATTDQIGPGSHVLYRDIHLKRNMKHELSFYLYYRNFNNRFFTPNTLDFTADRNQQYRVDLLKPSANPFSVSSNAILRRLFRTKVGDPNTLAPQRRTYNLTPYAGETVRLRFAEVDNQFFFLASTDEVKVKSTKRR